MPQDTNSNLPWKFSNGPADEILSRAPQDLVFSMQFLGESQQLLLQHFRDFISAELKRQGVGQDNYPLLGAFVANHAVELRDFVFAGLALSRQFHIGELENLIGDSTNLLRTDIWDQLSEYIRSAEAQFQSQAKDFPELLAQLEKKDVRQERS